MSSYESICFAEISTPPAFFTKATISPAVSTFGCPLNCRTVKGDGNFRPNNTYF